MGARFVGHVGLWDLRTLGFAKTDEAARVLLLLTAPHAAAQLPVPMSRMAMLWTTLVKNSVLLFHTVVFVIAMLPASVKKAAPGAPAGVSFATDLRRPLSSHVSLAPAVEAWYFTRLDHIVFTALMALAQYYKHTRAYLFVKPLPVRSLRAVSIAATHRARADVLPHLSHPVCSVHPGVVCHSSWCE